jgi:hypothetical protein
MTPIGIHSGLYWSNASITRGPDALRYKIAGMYGIPISWYVYGELKRLISRLDEFTIWRKCVVLAQ